MDASLAEKILTTVKQQIPLIDFAEVKIIEVTEESCLIKIPLIEKTKNHLNSMYFGALSIGADCAGGLIALYLMEKMNQRLSLVFKDFKADFLRRADSDVYFRCENGALIKKKILEAINLQTRVSFPVQIHAFNEHQQNIANFTLTLSLKPE